MIWIRSAPFAFLVAVLMLAVACGGGDDDETNTADSPSAVPSDQTSDDYTGVVISRDLTTGQNRFSVGVLDADGPVLGADVDLSFIKVTGQNQGTVRFQSPAEFVELERYSIDETTGDKIFAEPPSTGAYVAQADFDETGDWAIQISGTADGDAFGPITLAFSVAPPEETLSVGDVAPKTRQTLASDVADISVIESMNPPDGMHDVAIADAVVSGKPTVILFGTPAFCDTLVCGPVMDAVMLPLSEQFADDANFIHVEPYFLETFRSGNGLCAVPAFNINLARSGVAEGSGPCPSLTEEELGAAGESWNLNTEPIVFVVDSEGNIAGKFEAIMSPGEVEDLLTRLI